MVAVAERDMGVMVPARSDVSKVETVVIEGDLSVLAPAERVQYYQAVCESVGLNPLTKPFEYLRLNNRLVLYATRGCTDQLRSIRGIEVSKLERERADDLAIVVAYGRDRTGRQDSAMGAVSIAGLKGEALANALMKAETKAKRRLTLSMSGLGLLDEIEVESVPGAWREDVDVATGELAAPKTLSEKLAEKAGTARDVTPEAPAPAAQEEAATVAPAAPPATTQCESTSPYEGSARCRLQSAHDGNHRSSSRESWE